MTNRKLTNTLLATAALAVSATSTPALADTDFASFDRRARAGEKLTVGFFGASLTWGANASDPQKTSYRANVAKKFKQTYPRAHFEFVDGAIGGTGSQLGVFRLQRDMLRYNPDLVFLDFSANDDIYSANRDSLASYESLVNRLVTQAKVPVVQVIFPFQWNVKPGEMKSMKRRDAHYGISRAYNTAVGDAIWLANKRVEEGKIKLQEIWPLDAVHPGDQGYALFGDAAWMGYQTGVSKKLVCRAPEVMLYGEEYMSHQRVRLSSLGALPQGWQTGIPNRVSAWFDGLMSRWLDDEVIATNRATTVGADGKKAKVPQAVAPFKLRFRGTSALLYGEETIKSGMYSLKLDGKLVVNPNPIAGQAPTVFSASSVRMGGNRQHVQPVGRNLDGTVEHTLEIVPQFSEDTETELRIESLCVAGPGASVLPGN